MIYKLVKYLFFSSYVLVSGYCIAQDVNSILVTYEDSLKKLAPKILNSKEDREKFNANERFIKTLERALSIDNSFDYPFDSLSTIARLVSPDKTFRIFNWNLPKSDGTYEYYGFIQVYNKKSKKYKLYRLMDKSSEIKSPENQILSDENWYGAHYYKIIYNKRKYQL